MSSGEQWTGSRCRQWDGAAALSCTVVAGCATGAAVLLLSCIALAPLAHIVIPFHHHALPHGWPLGWRPASRAALVPLDAQCPLSPDARSPSRWLEMETQPSSYQFLSFNAGPRICLGKALAELEGLYTLVGLLRRFSFQMPPGAAVPTYVLSTVLPVKGGLPMRVTRRQGGAAAAVSSSAAAVRV